MKRKVIIKIHLIATFLAAFCILSFFTSSLLAEIKGDEYVIKLVKTAIFYSLPILIVAMPVLGITGNKLSGNSKNPIVLKKKKRMSFIFINGMILISLACYLYYKAKYSTMDSSFVFFQSVELLLGIVNLTLIGFNCKDGLLLSKKSKEQERI